MSIQTRKDTSPRCVSINSNNKDNKDTAADSLIMSDASDLTIESVDIASESPGDLIAVHLPALLPACDRPTFPLHRVTKEMEHGTSVDEDHTATTTRSSNTGNASISGESGNKCESGIKCERSESSSFLCSKATPIAAPHVIQETMSAVSLSIGKMSEGLVSVDNSERVFGETPSGGKARKTSDEGALVKEIPMKKKGKLSKKARQRMQSEKKVIDTTTQYHQHYQHHQDKTGSRSRTRLQHIDVPCLQIVDNISSSNENSSSRENDATDSSNSMKRISRVTFDEEVIAAYYTRSKGVTSVESKPSTTPVRKGRTVFLHFRNGGSLESNGSSKILDQPKVRQIRSKVSKCPRIQSVGTRESRNSRCSNGYFEEVKACDALMSLIRRRIAAKATAGVNTKDAFTDAPFEPVTKKRSSPTFTSTKTAPVSTQTESIPGHTKAKKSFHPKDIPQLDRLSSIPESPELPSDRNGSAVEVSPPKGDSSSPKGDPSSPKGDSSSPKGDSSSLLHSETTNEAIGETDSKGFGDSNAVSMKHQLIETAVKQIGNREGNRFVTLLGRFGDKPHSRKLISDRKSEASMKATVRTSHPRSLFKHSLAQEDNGCETVALGIQSARREQHLRKRRGKQIHSRMNHLSKLHGVPVGQHHLVRLWPKFQKTCAFCSVKG